MQSSRWEATSTSRAPCALPATSPRPGSRAGEGRSCPRLRIRGRRPPSRAPAVTLGVRSALVSSDQAQVSYAVPRAGRVRLELFNARGARVATLLDGASDAGTQVLDWSAGSTGAVSSERRLLPATHRRRAGRRRGS